MQPGGANREDVVAYGERLGLSWTGGRLVSAIHVSRRSPDPSGNYNEVPDNAYSCTDGKRHESYVGSVGSIL